MLEIVLNFLFPPVCIVCGKIDKNWICKKCQKKVYKYLKSRIILKNSNKLTCYKTIENLNFRLAFINKKYFSKKYDRLLYIFEYKNIIRKLIIDYKFNDKAYINNFFSNEILKNKSICDILKRYDIIISVPLSRKKLMTRGYNQTDLIAKKVAKQLNIKYNQDLLLKVKDTKMQSSLTKLDRKNNIFGAFEFNFEYNISRKKCNIIR